MHNGSFLLHHQFSAVAQLCLTPCDPMDCSMPGFPAHHQVPELIQTRVHRVGDALDHLPAFFAAVPSEGACGAPEACPHIL